LVQYSINGKIFSPFPIGLRFNSLLNLPVNQNQGINHGK